MTDRSPFDSASWGSPGPSQPGPAADLPTPPKRPLRQRLADLVSGRSTGLPRPVSLLLTVTLAATLGLAAGVGVKEYVAQPFRVPSASMSPTLQDGDQIVVEKLSYLLGDPRRGQVVVFDGAGIYDGVGDPTTYYVKRVIAVGGDTVACCDKRGRLLVNGSPVLEPYLAQDKETEKFTKVTVPAGELFVMGDNRDNSLDSRYLGTIPVDQVVGHVFARTWPMKRIHTVPVE